MRIELNSTSKIATFYPETQHEVDQMNAWYTASSALTTVAFTQGTDTGREGHAVNPVLASKHKSVIVAAS